MEFREHREHDKRVLLTIKLPKDIVDWLDDLKEQMGIRSRGFIIEQLLRELSPKAQAGDHEVGES